MMQPEDVDQPDDTHPDLQLIVSAITTQMPEQLRISNMVPLQLVPPSPDEPPFSTQPSTQYKFFPKATSTCVPPVYLVPPGGQQPVSAIKLVKVLN